MKFQKDKNHTQKASSVFPTTEINRSRHDHNTNKLSLKHTTVCSNLVTAYLTWRAA